MFWKPVEGVPVNTFINQKLDDLTIFVGGIDEIHENAIVQTYFLGVVWYAFFENVFSQKG